MNGLPTRPDSPDASPLQNPYMDQPRPAPSGIEQTTPTTDSGALSIAEKREKGNGLDAADGEPND